MEKQIADGKKVGLLAKLASQAGYLYAQAVEGTQDNVNKAIFEKVWLLVVQVSASGYMIYSNYLLQVLGMKKPIHLPRYVNTCKIH